MPWPTYAHLPGRCCPHGTGRPDRAPAGRTAAREPRRLRAPDLRGEGGHLDVAFDLAERLRRVAEPDTAAQIAASLRTAARPTRGLTARALRLPGWPGSCRRTPTSPPGSSCSATCWRSRARSGTACSRTAAARRGCAPPTSRWRSWRCRAGLWSWPTSATPSSRRSWSSWRPARSPRFRRPASASRRASPPSPDRRHRPQARRRAVVGARHHQRRGPRRRPRGGPPVRRRRHRAGHAAADRRRHPEGGGARPRRGAHPAGAGPPRGRGAARRAARRRPRRAGGDRGSLRRGRETAHDIDIVATADDPRALLEALPGLPSVQRVLSGGDAAVAVRTHAGLRAEVAVVAARVVRQPAAARDRVGGAQHPPARDGRPPRPLHVAARDRRPGRHRHPRRRGGRLRRPRPRSGSRPSCARTPASSRRPRRGCCPSW